MLRLLDLLWDYSNTNGKQPDYYNVEIACYGCYQIILVQMGNSNLITLRQKLFATAARFAIQLQMGYSLEWVKDTINSSSGQENEFVICEGTPLAATLVDPFPFKSQITNRSP